MNKYKFCPECGRCMTEGDSRRTQAYQTIRKRRNPPPLGRGPWSSFRPLFGPLFGSSFGPLFGSSFGSMLVIPNISRMPGEKRMRSNLTANIHFFPTYPKLFMSKKVDDIRIRKFYQDREVLAHYNDVDIAKKMQLDKSSYSSYVNGRNPITNNFLTRFYHAFGEEIKDILEKQTGEKDRSYTKSNDLLEEQRQKIKELEGKYDKLATSHQLISMEIHRLDQKLDSILEDRLDKIETLLSLLIAEKKPASENPGEKDKENSKGNPNDQKKPTKRKLPKASAGEGESAK